MQPIFKKSLLDSPKVHFIPIDHIAPNPSQPRRVFDMTALRELADSIHQFGIIQPLSVRRLSHRYELVSGERRLRGARLAGLKKVPCLLVDIKDSDSPLLALIENLQRRDLDFFEEAKGIAFLIESYGLSQEQAALRLGKSQSAVANKLRLLRHPPDVVALLREHNLTERHARALLRLEDVVQRKAVLITIIENDWNVAQAERYIDRLFQQKSEPTQRKPLVLIKDVRLFFNTIDRALSMMRAAGVAADIHRDDTDADFVMTVRIPKGESKL
ncbi:MAG: ParB/RepB/Spo0J family partition protein [Oscillospiraceae bacterium]|nr:ParB/RepB/Spo0J family partition protein [Oscillospiraceae bacterium]